jgi:hypothetical protein
MKMLKQAMIFCVLSSFVIVFSSAKIDNMSSAVPVATSSQTSEMTEQKEMSFNELKNVVSLAKGSELSFKEKIVLKIFKKKIAKNLQNASSSDGKSQLVAAILAFFLGGIGIHRFYLGYTLIGILQIITLGGLGIWALIDFIRILTGDLKPKDGEYGTAL